MNVSKMRFFLLGVSVISLGVVLGTLLLLKLTPAVVYRGGFENALERSHLYGSVPDFSLTERGGKILSLSDLRNAIWIADFIYTNCTDTCPMQTAAMAQLQDQLPNQIDLKLVSFSVDPERDTPAVLSEYAARYKADARRWLFLTGDKKQVAHLVQDGFRLSAVPADDASGAVLHSTRFVLVDRQSRIRGYYDSRDREALQRLKNDVAKLLDDKKE
jgi:enediyne biosynthesis protein E4